MVLKYTPGLITDDRYGRKNDYAKYSNKETIEGLLEDKIGTHKGIMSEVGVSRRPLSLWFPLDRRKRTGSGLECRPGRRILKSASLWS